MNQDSSLCRFLPWDTDHFGVRIGVLESDVITPESMDTVRQWCQSENIACLYFLANPDNAESIRLAFDEGFRWVDSRVTLSLKLPHPQITNKDLNGVMRIADKNDIDQLKAIARVSHKNTRFYRDGKFDLKRCDQMYEIWIEKNVLNQEDVVYVCDSEQGLCGYITCLFKDAGRYGQMGLLAVTGNTQGRGYGKALVQQTISCFTERGCEEVKVVTQDHNITALRLYEKCGFLMESCEIWFHKWFV
ncbi:MAG: GNAT family N-acetyltransferase [Planctomycetes bacterium]|nr:GNAT family N-acetyltransferase [Planctomycetota bacterium]